MQIILSRNCPKCQKVIIYKNKKALYDARRSNSGCMKCRPTKTKLSPEEKAVRKTQLREYHQKYRKEFKKELKEKKRLYLDKIKKEGIDKYGGCCECCKESNIKFLTIEHKNGRKNDIKAFRKIGKKRTGKRMWAMAKSENWPDKYTVLCFNCNCGKSIYGECPHKLFQ